ncbi:importin alpha [Anaeramoeba flamelloides]|uniref:Importin subunit alpha n=1 Tax=Anaeramoeba flamelloides TaxID=1746091 RepID=A0ABQ8YEN1_9EUKA|nr:importin alpha [Anaeramoeba flamelloides]
MSFEKKLLKRKNKFKTKLTRHDSTNKRKKLLFSISKRKKKDLIRKKRNITRNDENSEEYNQLVDEILERLPEISSQLSDPNCTNKLELVHDLRIMISGDEEDPPIDELIDSMCVAYLLEFLEDDNDPELQFESAWVLTNVASGNSLQTQFLVDFQGIPAFIRLLSSPNENVLDQSIWALGNIAGDCVAYRDEILDFGVFPKLLEIVQTVKQKSIIKNTIWTISNLVRRNPLPPLKITQEAFPIFTSLIQDSDYEIQKSAFWGLNYLSTGEYENIQVIIESKILPILLNSLETQELNDLIMPSLLILVNITSGQEHHTQTFINEGGIGSVKPYFTHRLKKYRKEACLIISNICAGTHSQIDAIIDNGFLDPMIEMIKNDQSSIKKEACFALTNIVECGNLKQLNLLLSKQMLVPLCNLLNTIDDEVNRLILRAIEKLLEIETETKNQKNNSSISQIIENIGAKDQIELLTASKISNISKKAVLILNKFYNYEIEDNSELVEDYNTDEDSDSLINYEF